jgi:small-conductance mechanosensitive channel
MDQVYFGNTVSDYLIALGSILLAWVVLKVAAHFLIVRIKKIASRTNNRLDDVAVSVIEKYALPYVYILVNYQILLQLNLHPRLQRVMHVAMAVVTTYFLIRLVNHAMHLTLNRVMERRNETPERIRQLNGVLNVVKAVFWFGGFIFLLDNLGYNVTTIIAGLGVGGIAIALAAQTVLGDLFNYFVIFFDRPFEIGDFITVGNEAGNIEKIGIKTTRIRSLTGEQLVISNTDLTKSIIHNFKRLEKRRVVFVIRVAQNTPNTQLAQIPDLIKEIITRKANVELDRVHLAAIGDYSFNFEVVYLFLSPDYNVYMDTQQQILSEILQALESRGVSLAFPSQQLFVKDIGVEKEPTGDKAV